MPAPVYSLVIPVFNESATLPELQRRLTDFLSTLDGPAEVVLIDDGSSDETYKMMQDVHAKDGRFKVIQLSRNFGHQIAITAGMDMARGQAIIIMDADLQDPPEVIHRMIARWKEGYEIVYAVRRQRLGESWLKLWTARTFYRLLQRLSDVRIPLDVGDFRLVDHKAMDAFRSMREHNRFVRGMFSWIGFKQMGVEYDRPERFAGETKYPFRKMVQLAINGILSFSNIPLQLVLNFGFIVSLLSFLMGLLALILKFAGVYTIPGWASIVVALSFFTGVQLLVLGIIGQYVGRIYEEVRQRPLYIIRERHGFESAEPLA